MSQPDYTPADLAPASPKMAAKLTVNRAGRFTPAQRRVSLIAGLVALVLFLCPAGMVIQVGLVLLLRDTPVPTLGGVIFLLIGGGFMILFAGLIGVNVMSFLPEAFMARPVKFARGPLKIHVSSRERPELPFSYIVDDYSFAPYVVPAEIEMRPGAPYIAYYSARSRLLLSLAALDAPDGPGWEPEPR